MWIGRLVDCGVLVSLVMWDLLGCENIFLGRFEANKDESFSVCQTSHKGHNLIGSAPTQVPACTIKAGLRCRSQAHPVVSDLTASVKLTRLFGGIQGVKTGNLQCRHQ